MSPAAQPRRTPSVPRAVLSASPASRPGSAAAARPPARLAGFDAEVESEQGQRQMAGWEMEWAQGGGEAESVDEAEEEAYHPALGGGVAEADVLEGHVDDGCRDDALDEPFGDGDEAEDGQGERDAVGDGEGRDDLEEREEAPSPEQQRA